MAKSDPFRVPPAAGTYAHSTVSAATGAAVKRRVCFLKKIKIVLQILSESDIDESENKDI